jgi:hypothetical protein
MELLYAFRLWVEAPMCMQKSGLNGTVSDTIRPMQEAFSLCNKVLLEVSSQFAFLPAHLFIDQAPLSLLFHRKPSQTNARRGGTSV